MGLLQDLQNRVLIADGAMGTLLYSYGIDRCFEELNLSKEDEVKTSARSICASWCGHYSNKYVRRELY